MAEHDLMFDDSFYLDMAKHDYERNVQRWMGKESVLNKAASMPRSKKKLNELWKKGALQIGDTMTMKKTAGNGNDVFFSATIEALGRDLRMRTVAEGDGKLWSCQNPADFESKMVQTKGDLDTSSRNIWDAISVRRANEELGSLFLLRQCLELWENEMEKWGCDGLGERLGDRYRPTN